MLAQERRLTRGVAISAPSGISETRRPRSPTAAGRCSTGSWTESSGTTGRARSSSSRGVVGPIRLSGRSMTSPRVCFGACRPLGRPGRTPSPAATSSRDEVVYDRGPRRDPRDDLWHGKGRLTPALPAISLERTTGFEPATPTLAISWLLSHASPGVSAGFMSCAFVYPLVSSVSLVSRSRLHFVGDFVGVALARGVASSGARLGFRPRRPSLGLGAGARGRDQDDCTTAHRTPGRQRGRTTAGRSPGLPLRETTEQQSHPSPMSSRAEGPTPGIISSRGETSFPILFRATHTAW